jgi:hypothetical protein
MDFNMDRQTRIRLVCGLAVTLFGIFVAVIGVPLFASLLWPDMVGVTDADGMIESFTQAAHIAQIMRTVAMISLLVSCVTFIYCLVVLARWFIASAEAPSKPRGG